MTGSGITTFCALCWVLESFAGTPARANPSSCESIDVAADRSVLNEWPDLVERVRTAFAERADVDSCARVRLSLIGGSIDLQVSLPDGRSASRSTRPEDLMATLEALLVVPTAAAPAAASPSPRPVRLESSAPQIRSDGPRPALDPPEPQRRLFAVELSLETGVHGGDGQTSASLGASSFLDIRSWLAGFMARLDRYGSGAAGENQDAPTAATLGALVGRRFRFRHLTVDAAAGPALAFRGSWSVAMATSTANVSPGGTSSSYNGLLPRGLLSGRLTLGARSTVRTFLGIEGELGATGPVPPGALRGLPLWTAGAVLGVTLGTL